ncbi:hypothetical protein PI95_008775 [Hassallia byssoidea VB512170]|uniref:Uncharacterized protein n=1 Tax=Hassallia byssoidea VB512170 TaxID=1304833 RepID=A0A846H7J6_9CYAN|nr:hypothetical protein [Hassalia byssoidea]NEU72659.1 hypothetical protein [Hassalia byssoidea VB512170]
MTIALPGAGVGYSHRCTRIEPMRAANVKNYFSAFSQEIYHVFLILS